MEFAKTKKGWIDLETKYFYSYGEIALKIYNSNQNDLDNVISKLKKHYSFSSNIVLSKNFITSAKRIMSDEQLKELKAPQSNGPYLIIGKQDILEDFEKEIFKKDQTIIAIMLYYVDSPFYATPNNGLPFNKDTVYLPLYKNEASQIFNTPYEMEVLQSYRRLFNLNISMGRILNYVIQGFSDLTALTVSSIQNFCTPLRSSVIWLNDYYYDKFIVETSNEVYALCYRDILELVNLKYSLDHCPICKQIFIKRDKRVNFCPKCSADKKAQKKYNDQKRKRNTIQIEHKAIVDMLRNRNEDYNDFVNESYYYKDLIEGKEVPVCPDDYNSSIQTEKQYEEWLKMKHKELTKRPKKHPAR